MKTNLEIINENKDFLGYVFSFYGYEKGLTIGMYSDFFKNKLSKKKIESMFPTFLRKYIKVGRTFCGDSVDREMFRDYMLITLKIKTIDNVEHQWIKFEYKNLNK
jgi:hypothetical protein